MKKMFSKIAVALTAIFSICLPITSQALTVATRGPHIHYFDGMKGKDIVRLEDGSEWRAATPNEAYIAHSWRPVILNAFGEIDRGDRLVLSPNNGLFTEANYYPFYITNQEDGTYIRVEPVASPIQYGKNSFWVFNTNKQLGHVYLVSGQGGDLITWEISSSYSHTVRDWEPNDHIVIGVNEGIFSFFNSYNYILINFNKASFVQARPH